jgi:predicted phage-related endonuclease
MTNIETTARTYRELQAEINALEEQADALKQEMIKELDAQKADVIKAGEYTVRYTIYESSRFDSTKFKADNPTLYTQYNKKTASLRFQVA